MLKCSFSHKPLSCQAEVANKSRERLGWKANGERRNYSFCAGQFLLQLYWAQVIYCDLWMLMEETRLDVENKQGDDS